MDGFLVQQGVGAPNKVLGTTTNDSAAAGYVGEYIESIIASASAAALTTGNALTITSISLTAGDWDVNCQGAFTTATTTSITALFLSISQTTNALDLTTAGAAWVHRTAAIVPGAITGAFRNSIAPIRISLAGTTTIYFVAQGVFTVAALTAYGIISARRAR